MRHSNVQENKNDSNYFTWMRPTSTAADKGKLNDSQMSARTSVKPHVTRALFFFISCLCEPTGAVSWDKQWLPIDGKEPILVKQSPIRMNHNPERHERDRHAAARAFEDRNATAS